MTYRLLGFAPDPAPLAELDDLAEAVERCERLVHEAGYRCAELWDEAGAVVFRAGCRPGTFTRSTPGELAARRPSGGGVARAARPSDRELPIPVVRDDDRVARGDEARREARAAARGDRRPSPDPAALASLALASLAASALPPTADGPEPRGPEAARELCPPAPRPT